MITPLINPGLVDLIRRMGSLAVVAMRLRAPEIAGAYHRVQLAMIQAPGSYTPITVRIETRRLRDHLKILTPLLNWPTLLN